MTSLSDWILFNSSCTSCTCSVVWWCKSIRRRVSLITRRLWCPITGVTREIIFRDFRICHSQDRSRFSSIIFLTLSVKARPPTSYDGHDWIASFWHCQSFWWLHWNYEGRSHSSLRCIRSKNHEVREWALGVWLTRIEWKRTTSVCTKHRVMSPFIKTDFMINII